MTFEDENSFRRINWINKYFSDPDESAENHPFLSQVLCSISHRIHVVSDFTNGSRNGTSLSVLFSDGDDDCLVCLLDGNGRSVWCFSTSKDGLFVLDSKQDELLVVQSEALKFY